MLVLLVFFSLVSSIRSFSIILPHGSSIIINESGTRTTRRSRSKSIIILNNLMELWLDVRSCDDLDNNGSITPSLRQRIIECDRLLAESDDKKNIENLKKNIFWLDGNLLFDDEHKRLLPAAKIIDVSTPEGQDEGFAAMGSVPWVLADILSSYSGAWKMIPAENLIVVSKTSGTKLAFCVQKEEDILGLSRALELGVDALCLKHNVSQQFWEAAKTARAERNKAEFAFDDERKKEEKNSSNQQQHTVITGKCRRSKEKRPVLADRVCVDFVKLLTPDEGCWIGSSAKATALVLSEAASSSLVPSRPFRINAGPVHSYVLMADGAFRYLCELEAGDEVSVFDSKTGETRSVAVGRLKIETRPCLIVELFGNSEAAGTVGQVFLQQAETVRLGVAPGSENRFVRVTDLTTSHEDEILIRTSNSGTHVGKAYTGKVVEK